MQKKHITIGIIGFGRFGALVASILREYAEIKIYHYRKKEENEIKAKRLGAKLTSLREVAECDIVILSVPISQTKKMIKNIASFVKPKTLVLDTCSVKTYPCRWLEKYLPEGVEIMGTHPMFGPVTTKFNFDKQTWILDGLQIVLCPLRINAGRLKLLKGFLSDLNLKIIETSPEDHDRQNATTLSLVHFLGRSLTNADIREQEIFTPGFSDLLKILPHTNQDNWQLFYDMNNYNPYAKVVRENFLNSCQTVEKKIIKSDSRDDFDYNRKKIDYLDKKIFKLLEERFACAEVIGKIKKEQGLAVVDRVREEAIIKEKTKQSNLDDEFTKKMYKLIFSEAYKKQV